ncbi:MAG: AAA family ATPase [candidate division WOR-3 bacterium]|nr:AAA family ATPase [candidate division WOR-3 bacterium]
MKIKSIKLKDYGPIRNLSLELSSFNVVFGRNETGKTTLVEALISSLFKTRTRYGKPAEITIELIKDKKTIILPSSRPISVLPRTEIASLLYIPASESELYEKTESQMKFWDSLKLMLSQTGTQIPFAILIKKLREGIGYQPKEDNWKADKRRLIENDKNRLEQLHDFIKEIGEVENKKKILKKLIETHTRRVEELDEIEKFKKFKLYQHLRNLYNDYIDRKNSLLLYEIYTEDDLNRWQELVLKKKSIENQEKEKAEVENEIKKLNEEYNNVLEKLKFVEKYNVKEKLFQYKDIEKEPDYFYPVIIFLIGFIVLILSFRLNFSIAIPLSIFLLSIISTTIIAIKKTQIKIKKIRKEEFLNDVKLFLPEIEKFSEIEKRIQYFENEKIRIESVIGAKKERLVSLSSPSMAEEIDKEIEKLRKKTGCIEPEQLKKKIGEKNRLENEKRGLGAEISRLLGEQNDSKWQRLIDEKKTPPPLKEIDLSNVDEIENELRDLKKQIEKIQSDIKIFEEVKKKQYNISEEKKVLREIAEIEGRLKNYSMELEAVKKAEEILNQMSNELDNFIENLIHGTDSLSEYYFFVTRKYNKVKIENQNFIAVDEEGNEYPLEKLSSGAKDQLLICFRLSALKKLFPEGTFLILDDAFIFADWERRCRLVELLKRFIDDGNQVIYFTSDEHSRDLLAQYGAEVVTL